MLSVAKRAAAFWIIGLLLVLFVIFLFIGEVLNHEGKK